MSLLRVRKRRKKQWIDSRKGMSSGRLVACEWDTPGLALAYNL